MAKKERRIVVVNRDDIDPAAIDMCMVCLAQYVLDDPELMEILENGKAADSDAG
jgi:hypothetical protein